MGHRKRGKGSPWEAEKPVGLGRHKALTCSLAAFLLGGVFATAISLLTMAGGSAQAPSSQQPAACSCRSVAQLVALSDAELEQVDLVEMNIAVAREIPGLEKLDYDRYRRIVDGWTDQFRRWLPTVVYGFRQNPRRYKDDIHFFHLGMLAQFLGQQVGIAYVEDQKEAQTRDRKEGRKTGILYVDPGHLLLHGLIDTKRGTCGTMSTLHVAIARRLSWPVGLACANSHFVSRYDDGKVVYNIEATHTDGGFSEGSDRQYMEIEGVTEKAIACGSDLRKLSGREMLGIFVASRGRHFNDTGKLELAARDYALAYTLVPTNRKVYEGLLGNLVDTGDRLFADNEYGHPVSLVPYLEAKYGPRTVQVVLPARPRYRPNPSDDADRINAVNRANTQRMMQPRPTQPPVAPQEVLPLTSKGPYNALKP